MSRCCTALAGLGLLLASTVPTFAQGRGLQCTPDVPNPSFYRNCHLRIVNGQEVCRCEVLPSALLGDERSRRGESANRGGFDPAPGGAVVGGIASPRAPARGARPSTAPGPRGPAGGGTPTAPGLGGVGGVGGGTPTAPGFGGVGGGTTTAPGLPGGGPIGGAVVGGLPPSPGVTGSVGGGTTTAPGLPGGGPPGAANPDPSKSSKGANPGNNDPVGKAGDKFGGDGVRGSSGSNNNGRGGGGFTGTAGANPGNDKPTGNATEGPPDGTREAAFGFGGQAGTTQADARDPSGGSFGRSDGDRGGGNGGIGGGGGKGGKK